jgi:hypothetical protein
VTEPDDLHNLDDDTPEDEASRVSDAEERARLLAETMAHATAQDAEYRRIPMDPGRRTSVWKGLTSTALVMAALLLLLAPPGWLTGPPLPSLTPLDLERGLRAVLFLQAEEIEAFHFREGRLPRSLGELDRPFPGLRYVRSNNRVYQLVALRPDGTVLVYDSAHPTPQARGLARRWLREPPRP